MSGDDDMDIPDIPGRPWPDDDDDDEGKAIIGRVHDLDEATFVRLAMDAMEPEYCPREELMRK